MVESLQHKLDRVRPPRVQITYDVEIGNAIEMKELPFVVGVLGDFAGKSNVEMPKMKDRKFVEIDRDNFNQVLHKLRPRVAMRVDDKLSGNADSQLGIELEFKSLDDFHPDNIVQQVPSLKKMIEARRKLSDLLSRMDGNNKLEELLTDVIGNTEKQKKLGRALGLPENTEGTEGPANA